MTLTVPVICSLGLPLDLYDEGFAKESINKAKEVMLWLKGSMKRKS